MQNRRFDYTSIIKRMENSKHVDLIIYLSNLHNGIALGITIVELFICCTFGAIIFNYRTYGSFRCNTDFVRNGFHFIFICIVGYLYTCSVEFSRCIGMVVFACVYSVESSMIVANVL